MVRARRPPPTREEVRDGVRPRTRGDCEDGPRPCPWVGCRHHLLVDVGEDGRLLKSRPFDEHDADSVAFSLLSMPETCALDVAGAGAKSLEETGDAMGLTLKHVSDIETEAKRLIRKAWLF